MKLSRSSSKTLSSKAFSSIFSMSATNGQDNKELIIVFVINSGCEASVLDRIDEVLLPDLLFNVNLQMQRSVASKSILEY